MKRKSLKVLLVEDDKLAQTATRLILQQLDCQVDVADDAMSAIKLIDHHLYDLIFMDLGLPGIDGITLTETICKFKDKKHSVPIIALTAHLEDIYKEKGFTAGLTDFLVKPLTLERTKAMIDQYVLGKI